MNPTAAGRLARRAARSLVAVALFGAPLVLLTFAVRQRSGAVVALDDGVIRAATDVARAAHLVPLLVVVQELTQPVVVYAVSTLVVVRVAVVTRTRGRATWAFVTMMAGWGLGALAKLLVRRARPVVDSPLSHPHGYSFPSGHALNATTAAAVLLVLTWPLMSPARRRIAVAVAVLAVLLVDLDRVLLGAHFPSDVVAGHLVGVGLTLASWTAFVRPTAVISSSESSPPASASGG